MSAIAAGAIRPAGRTAGQCRSRARRPSACRWAIPAARCPAFITEALAKSAASFGNYPAITGTRGLARGGGAAGSTRRFALNGAIDPEKHVLPLNGTREGLFSVLFPLMPLTQGRRASRSWRCPILFISAMPPPRWRRAPSRFMCPRPRQPAFCPIMPACREAMLERHGRGLYLLALQSRRRGGERRLLAAICSRWPSAMISSCWRMNVMPIFISTSRRSAPCRRGCSSRAALPGC